MPLTASDMRLRIPLDPVNLERLRSRPILRNRAMKARPAIQAVPHKTTYAFKIWDDVPSNIRSWIIGVIADWNDLFGTEVLVECKEGERIDLAIGAREFTFAQPTFESAPVGFLLPYNPKPYSEPQDIFGECILHWDRERIRRVGQIWVVDDLDKFSTRCAFAHELGHFFLLGHDKEVWRLMHRSLNGVLLPQPREMEWIKVIHGFGW